MKHCILLIFSLFCIQSWAFSNSAVASFSLPDATLNTPSPKVKSWKYRLALKIINKKIQKIARKKEKQKTKKKTDDRALIRKATWALVFSILGLLLISALVGIIFTIFSAKWIKQIKEELFLIDKPLFDFEGKTLIELAKAFNLATLILLGIYILLFIITIGFLFILLN